MGLSRAGMLRLKYAAFNMASLLSVYLASYSFHLRRLVRVSAPAVPPITAPAPAPRPRPRIAPPAAPPAAPMAIFLARLLRRLRVLLLRRRLLEYFMELWATSGGNATSLK